MITVRPTEYGIFGLRIFPCHSIKNGRCTCGKLDCNAKGKHPRVNGWQKQATSDPATIQHWIEEFGEENINWGMATGLGSRLWVVDIDPQKSGFESWEKFEEDRSEPFNTLKSITGGGGRHLFFRTDGKPTPNRVNWLPGVDIRGDGGYVILPDGRHASGGHYEWIDWGSTVPQPGPLDILESLRQTGTGSSTPTSKTDWSGVLGGIPEGERDTTLFRYAAYLRRKLDDDRRAIELLVLEAAANCNPPFPEAEALAKVDQAFKQDHSNESWMVEFAKRLDSAEESDGPEIVAPTEQGNARRFVIKNRNDIRYVPEWGWMRWTRTGWKIVPEEQIEAIAKKVPELIRKEAIKLEDRLEVDRLIKWSFKSETAGAMGAIIRLARSDSDILRNAEGFDNDQNIIACRNGILDLRTGDLRKFTREDLITRNTGIDYDPDSHLSEWSDFLASATEGDKDLMEYLQRAAGYTLTGSVAEECFFIISGPPASGKSTFVDALYGALGSYATTTQSETFMHRRNRDTPRDELARFMGMRMVSMSEIREGELFNESLVKQVTGGDKISARFLYKNGFTFDPQFKLWIATNHDPSSQDDAMLRRIKRIMFPRSIPFHERNLKLKDLLKAKDTGGRAVLAWAVEGAMKYFNEGLKQPTTVTAAVHAYKSDNDVFSQFMNETFQPSPNSRINLSAAFNRYAQWCTANSEYVGKRAQFKQKMVDRQVAFTMDGPHLVFLEIAFKPLDIGAYV